MASPFRRAALALAGCCALTATACAPDTPAPPPRVTLAFWTMPFWIGEPDKLQELVDDFNVSQSRVTVSLTVLDWATGRDTIKKALAAGNGPDIWLTGNGLDADDLDAGRLAPLDTLGYTRQDLDRFIPLAQVDADGGRMYGAPLYFDTEVLLYRTDVLRQYGFDRPPGTWAELKSTAATITARSTAAGHRVDGWQFKGMDDHLNAINATWETFLCQAGGRLTDADHRNSAEDSEAGRTALAYLKSFYTDKVSRPGVSALNGFVDGEVAMFSFYQSVISDIAAGNEKTLGKWAVAPMPTGPAGGCSALGGHALVARSHLSDPTSAGQFMRWLASPKNSAEFLRFHGIYPYDTDRVDPELKVAVEAHYAAEPGWEAVSRQLARNTPDQMLQDRHAYTARWDAHKDLIPAAVLGRTDAGQALAEIDRRVDRALHAGG
ncbi:ABC transporter substrate-binding protein [Kitasatospora cineracea]|uniref:ABC-type glycerol-3-phosphate transport system substrate-binding protein n=1 Tax=Kitasatospora cineracea TaxID=88074 RepID=A0A8G1UM67_9ACTN|nr:extracellular solute-binding protein [Kitasatospora cineracea]ROR46423.1 ABC-type glycerol-3-phosphate transport system substrate-binding protein [Kitasatospora cineracea]